MNNYLSILLLYCVSAWFFPLSVNANQPKDVCLTSVYQEKYNNETTSTFFPSAKDKIIIKRNVVNGVNLLKQDMFPKGNTTYVIKYDFVLASNITIPQNSVLLFDGGKISGKYIIDFNGARLLGLPKLLCKFTGEVDNNDVDVTWFGETNEEGLNKLNEICTIASVIVVPKGEYKINKTISVNNITYKTIEIYGNIISDVDKGYCFEFDDIFYSNISFNGRIDGNRKTEKGILIKTAKFNYFKFTIISKFINCIHIQPSIAFAHNDITLGVIESDYDDAELLLLDGTKEGCWLNENYFHNGYFGRNSSSTAASSYVTGVKYLVGNSITNNTTTFNDNMWRDVCFEHINTVFWFNHTCLNIVDNMRVERCGRALNSPLIKAYNLSRNNRINNLLYGANESLSYDVFENGIIWGEICSPLFNDFAASYDISYKDIEVTSQIERGYANCKSKYFSLVNPSDLRLSKNFRYKLSDSYAYNAAYSDLPAIVVNCQDNSSNKTSSITISSDTDVKVYVGILETVSKDKNNHVLSNDTAGKEGLLKTYNTSKKKVILLSDNVKKTVIAFKYNNSTSGVFKHMHIETTNCTIDTNP